MVEKKCIKCGEMKQHKAKGMCKKCYDRTLNGFETCVKCGEERTIVDDAMCYFCHKKYIKSITECIYCGAFGVTYKELCEECYMYYCDTLAEKRSEMVFNNYMKGLECEGDCE